jgi:signal transduction histidine kinase
VEVQDQGHGISPERLQELQSQGAGVGIRGMRERVLRLGGELDIRSDSGGTTVSIILPFKGSSAEPGSGPLQDPPGEWGAAGAAPPIE